MLVCRLVPDSLSTLTQGARSDQEQRIPSEDLSRQFQLLRDELMPEVEQVLASGKYTMGPNLAAFEQEWAAYCGAGHAIGISSGTAALALAYRAVGVEPGDEVIVPAMTYVATAFAVTHVGGVPVFVDVDERTFTVDPEEVRKALSPRTKAIAPVHLYGQAVEVDAIRAIAAEHGLAVIEDAAQAHGATFNGARAGTLGDVGCFSFYPHKNLGTYGDGGAITTNDRALAERLRILRYVGQRTKHVHEVVGFQERLDELQAAVLRVRLRHLDAWNEERRRWAALYDELLADTPVTTPFRRPACEHVYYMYTVLAPDRDRLRESLEERGIGSQVIYPSIVPDQPAYRELTAPHRTLAVDRARRLAGEILSLPVFPELREVEVRTVAAAVRAFYGM
jgi:dTDP-4-amino-4,6-dideoxygalactose transaminase